MENREYISPTIASVGPTAQIGFLFVENVIIAVELAAVAVGVYAYI